MVVLDVTVVNIALPSAQRDLHIATADRQWVITAYTLAFGGLLLLGGRIVDLVGPQADPHHRTDRLRRGLRARRRRGQASHALRRPRPAGRLRRDPRPAALSLLTTTFTDPDERAKAFGIFGAIAGAGGASA